MLIEVTVDDIKNGIPGDECACPIALAIMRAFPNAYLVSVNGDSIMVHYSLQDDNEDYNQYDSPASVDSFISKFDNEEFRSEVKPFEFELE